MLPATLKWTLVFPRAQFIHRYIVLFPLLYVLGYTGIDKHEGEKVGGWDIVIKEAEYRQFFFSQQATTEGGIQEESPPAPAAPTAPPAAKEAPAPSTAPAPKATTPIGPKATSPSAPHQTERADFPCSETAGGIQAPDVEDGMTVVHAKFGEGTVKIAKAKNVIVTFEAGEKKFNFPDAFKNGFLKLKES